MFFKVHLPRVHPKPYETEINKRLLNKETLNWEKEKFQTLLKLRTHATKINDSIYQLKQITDNTPNLLALERLIDEAFKISNFNLRDYKNRLNNLCALVEEDLKQSKLGKFFSFCDFFIDMTMASCAAMSVILFPIVAMVEFSLALALLSTVAVIASTIILGMAIYSAYVEIRYLDDQQIQEIKTGINALLDSSSKLNSTLPKRDNKPNNIFPMHDDTIMTSQMTMG